MPTSKAWTRTRRIPTEKLNSQLKCIHNISVYYLYNYIYIRISKYTFESNIQLNIIINSYADPKSLEHESGLAMFSMMFQLSQSKPKMYKIRPHREVLSSSVAWELTLFRKLSSKTNPNISHHVEFTKTVFLHELLDSMNGYAKQVAHYVKNTVLHSFSLFYIYS